MPERKILNSWKEIASYLGKGVRTVQRQESELKLPISLAGVTATITACRPLP